MKSQETDIEKNKLIKNGKAIGIDEIIKQNERINNNSSISLKYKHILKQCYRIV